MPGRAVGEYRAPLFIAWQLTNRCNGQCLACCEESGPDRAWADELSRAEALRLAGQIADYGIPYVAFGGGEPLGVPHCWEIFARLKEAGTALKLETDGSRIDDIAALRLAELDFECIQISVDGASAATHDRVRPGSSFAAAVAAIERLVRHGQRPQLVFAPNRFNIAEAVRAYELALSLGCSAFVSGPLMRIGRAAANWTTLACDPEEWERAVAALRARADSPDANRTALSIYPWDIQAEMRRRLEAPQAMLLVVPNGKVKLLNALPFAPADLRGDSLQQAWDAYLEGWRRPEVRSFVAACESNAGLLLHANETWPPDRWQRGFEVRPPPR